jgi:hypothetical protein
VAIFLYLAGSVVEGSDDRVGVPASETKGRAIAQQHDHRTIHDYRMIHRPGSAGAVEDAGRA